ncbi:MAG: hypothetical protein EXR62_07305 [Chloroflexi bacterium]|nr:hypothetical protein [Chloroflexota bacterium]
MQAGLPITGPLGLGDLLDRAFRLYRARFWTLLMTAAIFLIPIAILSGLSTGLFTSSVDALSRLNPTPGETPAQVMGALGSVAQGYGIVFIMSILTYFVSGLVTLALTAQTVATLHNQRLTLAESVRAGLNRYWAFLAMSIVQAVCFFFATLIVLIPLFLLVLAVAFGFGFSLSQSDNTGANAVAAIGLGFGLLCGYFFALLAIILPTAFLSARWIVATPGLVAQGWGPVQALQRSWALTRGQTLRCIGYLLLLWLLSLLVTGLPILVIQQFILALLPQSLGWASGISTALGSIANVLWQPLYVAAIVLLYYDLRVRHESYDLALRVGRLEAEVRASETQPDSPAGT